MGPQGDCYILSTNIVYRELKYLFDVLLTNSNLLDSTENPKTIQIK